MTEPTQCCRADDDEDNDFQRISGDFLLWLSQFVA